MVTKRTAASAVVLACAVSLALGWGIGAVMNPRVNTVALMAHMQALDIQLREQAAVETAAQRAELNAAKAAFTQHLQTLEADVAQMRTEAERRRQQDLAAAESRLRQEQEQYSERIIGLRQQLSAHGIREVVVR